MQQDMRMRQQSFLPLMKTTIRYVFASRTMVKASACWELIPRHTSVFSSCASEWNLLAEYSLSTLILGREQPCWLGSRSTKKDQVPDGTWSFFAIVVIERLRRNLPTHVSSTSKG